MVDAGGTLIVNSKGRQLYWRANKALSEAHDACLKAEHPFPGAMSHGPFSGVNEVLGVVGGLERFAIRAAGLAAAAGVASFARSLPQDAASNALNYVADMTFCGQDGEWHFKSGYDPQRVLDAIGGQRG